MTERVIPWEERMTQLDVATKAYIAGFLDGDGSIMLQIKPRKDMRFGFRLQATICFYQDSKQEKELRWIREQLNVGYISRRNDGMSELRINGFACIEKVLLELREFVRFKRRQVALMLKALKIVQQKMTTDSFLQACKIADEVSKANYRSNKKHTAVTVANYLKEKSFPVTTEA
ncbi:MAG: LAGLIDADG family homing endonuclease [Pyrinomonadaceae bacterium]